MASRRYKKCSTIWLFVSLGLIGLAFWLSSVPRANASPSYQAGGVDLDYVLTIDNPSSGQASVTMTVSNLSTSAFEVEEHGYHGVYINVLTLSAHDVGDNPLTVEHFPDSGTTWLGGQQADVWRVQCAGLSQIVIEYTVQPGLLDTLGWRRGCIAPDFAASPGEYVFLVPFNSATHSVTVSFNLPAGWNVYSPWTKQGDSYDPTLLGADIIDGLSLSSFALGQFDIYTQTVGTTEVAVAAYHGWPTAVKEELAQQSWDILAYQTSVFGGSVGDDYLAIFCPAAPDGRKIRLGEWSTSQGYAVRLKADGSYWGEWELFPHQSFHRWNSWVWGLLFKPMWFNEGSNEFYVLKTMTELRIEYPYDPHSINYMESKLWEWYNQYLKDYVATGNDWALADPNLPEDMDWFMNYRKGAMVNFLLAREIYLRTDGTHNFDDFLQVLVQKYGHHAAPCYEECLKAELATLTGTDFTQFFDDYVYGMTTLPMDWAFEDDDGDGLSNALEIGWDTHPENEDTDGDGVSDGVEVQFGSDPANAADAVWPVWLPIVLRNH